MREGKLHFVSRGLSLPKYIDTNWIIAGDDGDLFHSEMGNHSVVPARFEVSYVDAAGSYELGSTIADYNAAKAQHIESLQVDFAMSEIQARKLAKSSLRQYQIGRERISMRLAHLHERIDVGDEIAIEGFSHRFLVDRREYGKGQNIEGFALADMVPDFSLGAAKLPESPQSSTHIWTEYFDLPF